MPSTVRGNEYRLIATSTRVSPVLGSPAPMHRSATSQVVAEITPGSVAPPPKNPISSLHQGLGNPTVSNIATATAASSFVGVVTPLNALNVKHALSNDPNKEFVNKLYLELRAGARIGYSSPRLFHFSKILPTVSLNPAVVTLNLAEKVTKGRTVGPSRSPPPPPYFKISKFHLSALFLKTIQANFEQYCICPSPNKGTPS